MTESARPTQSRRWLVILRQLYQRVVNPQFTVYADELDRQRARALHLMSILFAIMGLGGSVALGFVAPNLSDRFETITNFVISLFYFFVLDTVHRGQLRRSALIFLGLALIVPPLQVVFGIMDPGAAYLSLAVPVVTATLLLGGRWGFLTTLISLAEVAGIGYLNFTRLQENVIGGVGDQTAAQARTAALIAGFLLLLLNLFSTLLSTALVRWAQSAQRRARQLEAAAVISETAASAPSLYSLLNTVVDRIREAFGFYHAQVFLLDGDARLARLEASTGRAGVALLARGHALRVGSQSMIGQCAYLGQPIVVNDTSISTVWRPNELLPDTRAELALPLKIGTQVIGVLDVQSNTPNVFRSEDIRSLQIMSQQLATTIEKTRLVDQLQSRASENQRLFEDAQASLRQVEDLNRRLTREGWSDFLASRQEKGVMGFTLDGDAVARDGSWTAPMRQAFAGEQSVVVSQEREAHIAAVPVRVRGEVIGVLEVQRGGDRPWTDEELDMAETLVERLALAVENARLYEQATQATEREQVINKITQDVQSATTIDEILQSALMELGQVLGASRGVVQISPKQEDHTRRSGKTGMLPQLES